MLRRPALAAVLAALLALPGPATGQDRLEASPPALAPAERPGAAEVVETIILRFDRREIAALQRLDRRAAAERIHRETLARAEDGGSPAEVLRALREIRAPMVRDIAASESLARLRATRADSFRLRVTLLRKAGRMADNGDKSGEKYIASLDHF